MYKRQGCRVSGRKAHAGMFDETLTAQLGERASHLIEAKWLHVEAVAEALLERGALDGDEVRAIIQGVEAERAPTSSAAG